MTGTRDHPPPDSRVNRGVLPVIDGSIEPYVCRSCVRVALDATRSLSFHSEHGPLDKNLVRRVLLS